MKYGCELCALPFSRYLVGPATRLDVLAKRHDCTTGNGITVFQLVASHLTDLSVLVDKVLVVWNSFGIFAGKELALIKTLENTDLDVGR
jgi:hypothetical protein